MTLFIKFVIFGMSWNEGFRSGNSCDCKLPYIYNWLSQELMDKYWCDIRRENDETAKSFFGTWFWFQLNEVIGGSKWCIESLSIKKFGIVTVLKNLSSNRWVAVGNWIIEAWESKLFRATRFTSLFLIVLPTETRW